MKSKNPHTDKNLTLLPRISRIIGQLEGLKKMIEDGRHCSDLIHVAKASCSAIHAVQDKLIEFHFEHRLEELKTLQPSSKESERIKMELVELAVKRKMKVRQ